MTRNVQASTLPRPSPCKAKTKLEMLLNNCLFGACGVQSGLFPGFALLFLRAVEYFIKTKHVRGSHCIFRWLCDLPQYLEEYHDNTSTFAKRV